MVVSTWSKRPNCWHLFLKHIPLSKSEFSGQSHTHAPGKVLTSFVWREGQKIIGNGEVVSLTLGVGVHNIGLTVADGVPNESTEVTTITVRPAGFPDITSLVPERGSISGGYAVTINGSGFTNSADLTVNFGLQKLTGGDIQVLNSNTITLLAPLESVPVPIQVSVESKSKSGTSNSRTFTYETAIPIAWESKLIADFGVVAVAVFGPDGKLYAANTEGVMAKITLDDNFNIISSVVTDVAPGRAILGMDFDPMTPADEVNPWIYFSSSQLFHKESRSSFGKAINGKIQRVRGANLDQVEDVVTGLPVADHDHGKELGSFLPWAPFASS